MPRRRVRRAKRLDDRRLDSVKAIGVDEIAYGHGHHYLTLVYQSEPPVALAGVGKKRPSESFEQFFRHGRQELAAMIEFVCYEP